MKLLAVVGPIYRRLATSAAHSVADKISLIAMKKRIKKMLGEDGQGSFPKGSSWIDMVFRLSHREIC